MKNFLKQISTVIIVMIAFVVFLAFAVNNNTDRLLSEQLKAQNDVIWSDS